MNSSCSSQQSEHLQMVDSVICILLSEKALCTFVRDLIRLHNFSPKDAIEKAFTIFKLDSILSLLNTDPSNTNTKSEVVVDTLSTKSKTTIKINKHDDDDDHQEEILVLKPIQYSATEPIIVQNNSRRNKWTKPKGSVRISQTMKSEFVALLKKKCKESALAKLDSSNQDTTTAMDDCLDQDPNRRRVRFPAEIVSAVYQIREPFTREESKELFYSFIDGMRFSYEHEEETARALAAGVSWNDWMLHRTDEDVALEEEAAMTSISALATATVNDSETYSETPWYEEEDQDYENADVHDLCDQEFS